MRNKVWLSLFFAAALSGCRSTDDSSHKITITYTAPDVLPIDSANKMLGSYLHSINYLNNDTDVQSFVFNAALLRKYLDSITGSSDIAFVKIMFAHKLAYINAGNGNRNDGLSNKALTFLVAGYTTTGNYIFYPNDLIIDNSMLCPNNCPPGTAANPFLPTSTNSRP